MGLVHPHFSPFRLQKTNRPFQSWIIPEPLPKLEDLDEVEALSSVDEANEVLLNVEAEVDSKEQDKVDLVVSSNIRIMTTEVVVVDGVAASAGGITTSHNEIVMLQ